MHEIDMQAFAAAHAAGATVIDVRQPSEYVAGHVPGARSIPLDLLGEHLPELRDAGPIYIVCASGVRSLTGATTLSSAGITAYSVAGGTNAWLAEGRRVVRGREPQDG